MSKLNQVWSVLFWFLAIVFIVGAITGFVFSILVYIWGKGMESFSKPSEFNITYILGWLVFFLPPIYFLGLTIISFGRKVHAKYITMVLLFTQVILGVLYALAIIRLNGKDESINMSLMFVGCSVAFWILFAAILCVKNKCGHFKC